MQKSALLKALQQEIRRHSFETFVYKLPSPAKEGRGVVVPGCPACEKRLETITQFLNHLTEDVLPALLDRLSTENKKAVVD